MAGVADEGPREVSRPATAPPASVRVRSPFIVLATLVLATSMVLAGLGGMYDPAPGYEGESPLLGWAWVAVWGGLGLRAMTLGASVRGDRLRIRNLWRTHDFSIADVESVDTDLYEGWMFGSVKSAWVRVVRVRLRGRWVRVWGLTSRASTAARLARRLEAACGLQPTPRARPQRWPEMPGWRSPAGAAGPGLATGASLSG